MKKNLFYLVALICSMSLFTACSDDEEPWKELPKGEISSDKVELTLNGAATTDGTVNFEALDAEKAVVKLKNVIDGYSDVAVNVDMKEQADGSFSFSGTQQIATKPVTRDFAQPAPFLTVAVNGTVLKGGTVNLNVTTQGLALYLGTYAGETLVLNCNGSTLEGKTVVLDATVGDKANFLLGGVLPGEPEAVLANVPFDGKNFSGKVATALYDVEVSGSKADKVLTLNLKATLGEAAQGGLAGTWNTLNSLTTDQETGSVVMAPLFLIWSALDSGKPNLENAANLINLFGSMALSNVLNQVTFHGDGNITAKYWDKVSMEDIMGGMDDKGNFVPSHTEWLDSPKNMAFWYVKENQLYVVPNINAILKQAGGNAGNTGDPMADLTAILAKLGEYNINVEALLPVVMEWLSTGIPLKYSVANDILKIYVDKEMVAPFMTALLPALDRLQADLDKILADPTNENVMLIKMALAMLGIEKLTDIQTIWNENTDVFELSLNLTK